MIEALIGAGASVNAMSSETDDMRTPLMTIFRSLRSTSLEDVERNVHLMIEAKADLELRDKHGWSALMYACVGKEHQGIENGVRLRDVPVSVVRLLLQAGVGSISHLLL